MEEIPLVNHSKEETDFSVDLITHDSYLFDLDKYTSHNTPKEEKKKKPRKPKKTKSPDLDSIAKDPTVNPILDL